MTPWPLPLIATTTGGRNPDRYCPACLSLWQRWSTDDKRALMHPACRDALQAIYSTPAQEAAS